MWQSNIDPNGLKKGQSVLEIKLEAVSDGERLSSVILGLDIYVHALVRKGDDREFV